eukprot:m.465541 g.465541  ORF g.465541 m.465541 type:complete len:378 (-) comp24319_c0_seq1:278-1411(-)
MSESAPTVGNDPDRAAVEEEHGGEVPHDRARAAFKLAVVQQPPEGGHHWCRLPNGVADGVADLVAAQQVGQRPDRPDDPAEQAPPVLAQRAAHVAGQPDLWPHLREQDPVVLQREQHRRGDHHRGGVEEERAVGGQRKSAALGVSGVGRERAPARHEQPRHNAHHQLKGGAPFDPRTGVTLAVPWSSSAMVAAVCNTGRNGCRWVSEQRRLFRHTWWTAALLSSALTAALVDRVRVPSIHVFLAVGERHGDDCQEPKTDSRKEILGPPRFVNEVRQHRAEHKSRANSDGEGHAEPGNLDRDHQQEVGHIEECASPDRRKKPVQRHVVVQRVVFSGFLHIQLASPKSGERDGRRGKHAKREVVVVVRKRDVFCRLCCV